MEKIESPQYLTELEEISALVSRNNSENSHSTWGSAYYGVRKSYLKIQKLLNKKNKAFREMAILI